jgi:hypothetical protein
MALTCQTPRCGQLSSLSWGALHFCKRHFIFYCYRSFEEAPVSFGGSRDPFAVLMDIADRAATLGIVSDDLDGWEKAQLLDILYRCAEMVENLSANEGCGSGSAS